MVSHTETGYPEYPFNLHANASNSAVSSKASVHSIDPLTYQGFYFGIPSLSNTK